MPTPPDRVPIRAPRHFVNTHLGPSTQGPQAQLLFDSGAETSVIDATTFDQALAANAVTALPSSGIKISHAGGGALSSQGTHLITITLSDGHTFDAPMVKVSNFPTPGIIGKNIIQALGLTVDPITNNLIRNVTEPIKGSTIASTIMAIDAHSLPQIMHPALSPDTPPDQQPTPEASPTIIKGPIMDVYEEPLVSDPNKLYTFHPTENYHISALSAVQRGIIIGARLAGASVSRTANLMGVSRSTVSRVMTDYTKLGKVSSAKQNSGRKSKLTDRDRRALKRIVALNRKTTLPQITSEMNTHLQNPVSTKTIQRELHAASIHGRVAIPKPLVSPQNAMKRRQWCRNHQNWTQQQ